MNKYHITGIFLRSFVMLEPCFINWNYLQRWEFFKSDKIWLEGKTNCQCNIKYNFNIPETISFLSIAFIPPGVDRFSLPEAKYEPEKPAILPSFSKKNQRNPIIFYVHSMFKCHKYFYLPYEKKTKSDIPTDYLISYYSLFLFTNDLNIKYFVISLLLNYTR